MRPGSGGRAPPPRRRPPPERRAPRRRSPREPRGRCSRKRPPRRRWRRERARAGGRRRAPGAGSRPPGCASRRPRRRGPPARSAGARAGPAGSLPAGRGGPPTGSSTAAPPGSRAVSSAAAQGAAKASGGSVCRSAAGAVPSSTWHCRSSERASCSRRGRPRPRPRSPAAAAVVREQELGGGDESRREAIPLRGDPPVERAAVDSGLGCQPVRRVRRRRVTKRAVTAARSGSGMMRSAEARPPSTAHRASPAAAVDRAPEARRVVVDAADEHLADPGLREREQRAHSERGERGVCEHRRGRVRDSWMNGCIERGGTSRGSITSTSGAPRSSASKNSGTSRAAVKVMPGWSARERWAEASGGTSVRSRTAWSAAARPRRRGPARERGGRAAGSGMRMPAGTARDNARSRQPAVFSRHGG
jgi:hypothetical protein